jgi:hypothetical protein
MELDWHIGQAQQWALFHSALYCTLHLNVSTCYNNKMAQQYDKILKEILKDVVETLITKVIGLKIVKATLIETKLQITNEREADFILLVELNILHDAYRIPGDKLL